MQLINQLHAMTHEEINQAACNKLYDLLERCTVNLIADLTGISRTTLYKWLDEDVTLSQMNHRDAAWFILYCETSPRVMMLLDHAPLTHPRQARKLFFTANQRTEDKTNGKG